MSRIDDLIRELCPDGVEFKALGQCVEQNIGGGTPSRSRIDYWDGEIHWASVGDITATNLALVNTRQTITELGLHNSSTKVIPAGWVVVAVKIVPGAMRVVLSDTSINQDLRGLKLFDNLEPYFLTYFFKTLKLLGNGTIVKGITNDTLLKIRIPVPPLEVQREIVRILDEFTALEAELEAELEGELEARRKQYEHYRDTLLTFPDGEVRWVPMGEVCSRVSSGGTPSSTNASYYGGQIPWLRTQDIDFNEILSASMTITDEGLSNSSAQWVPENTVVVAMYGATAAKVGVTKIPLTTNQACCNLEINPNIADFRYVFHWIASSYEPLKALGQGSQSNLNAKTVKDFKIPIPKLETQREIAATLDAFDALVNDISIGLPAEIYARRKQYEYYRDQLLTFKELTP